MTGNSSLLIIRTISDLRIWRQSISGTVGFIPTMGFLHDGHVSLIEKAHSENDFVVVSIFVNPKQFSPHEDFTTYPRNEKHDLDLLNKAHVTVAFLPEVEEMYPSGFETNVSVSSLSKKLEGEKRPGHFDGVATVVSKLFNIVQPTRAYFGQKDAQQVVIMKKMINDLQFPVKIIVGKTVRDENGLALSSRNAFLSTQEKKEAAVISQSLTLAQKLVDENERAVDTIKHTMKLLIEKTSGKVDYISIADPLTLTELTHIKDAALVSVAIYFGKTRLIDNCILTL